MRALAFLVLFDIGRPGYRWTGSIGSQRSAGGLDRRCGAQLATARQPRRRPRADRGLLTDRWTMRPVCRCWRVSARGVLPKGPPDGSVLSTCGGGPPFDMCRYDGVRRLRPPFRGVVSEPCGVLGWDPLTQPRRLGWALRTVGRGWVRCFERSDSTRLGRRGGWSAPAVAEGAADPIVVFRQPTAGIGCVRRVRVVSIALVRVLAVGGVGVVHVSGLLVGSLLTPIDVPTARIRTASLDAGEPPAQPHHNRPIELRHMLMVVPDRA